jgi:hypothetical protein
MSNSYYNNFLNDQWFLIAPTEYVAAFSNSI